jgi:hypothetical protein
MNTSFPAYRIIGSILVACGVLGYFTVADDLRHMGEFIGVSSVLLAGIILLIVDSEIKIVRMLALQWIAFGFLLGIPVGGIVLDNMPLGVGIGVGIGIIMAYLLRRH